MKEEGRFPYDQREAAEEKIELLRQKSKKLYFIQPLKEVIGEAPGTAKLVTAEIEEDDVKAVKKVLSEDEEDDEDEEEEEEEEEDDDDE